MKYRNALLSGLLILVLLYSLASVRTPAQAAFSDVPQGAWYAEAVNWCREQGIVNDGTAFRPEAVMTRAMVATALYRAAGSPQPQYTGTDEKLSIDMGWRNNFTDIPDRASYINAVGWCAVNQIITGYDDGTFRPDNPVTRQQFAAMLWRSAGSPPADTGTDYADEASISSYAKTAVDWARDAGVILGKDGNRFDPGGGATRAQAAVILYRYLNQKHDGGVSGEQSLTLTINGTPVRVKWEQNTSVDALLELVSHGPVTVSLSPYGGFEQVGSLGTSIVSPLDKRKQIDLKYSCL